MQELYVVAKAYHTRGIATQQACFCQIRQNEIQFPHRQFVTIENPKV